MSLALKDTTYVDSRKDEMMMGGKTRGRRERRGEVAND